MRPGVLSRLTIDTNLLNKQNHTTKNITIVLEKYM